MHVVRNRDAIPRCDRETRDELTRKIDAALDALVPMDNESSAAFQTLKTEEAEAAARTDACRAEHAAGGFTRCE